MTNVEKLTARFEAEFVGGHLQAVINGKHTLLARTIEGIVHLTAEGLAYIDEMATSAFDEVIAEAKGKGGRKKAVVVGTAGVTPVAEIVENIENIEANAPAPEPAPAAADADAGTPTPAPEPAPAAGDDLLANLG